jgi:hypothetical protein
VRETAVIEPTVPVGEEEPEAANMRLSITISCAEKEGLYGGGRVPVEEAQPISSIFFVAINLGVPWLLTIATLNTRRMRATPTMRGATPTT